MDNNNAVFTTIVLQNASSEQFSKILRKSPKRSFNFLEKMRPVTYWQMQSFKGIFQVFKILNLEIKGNFKFVFLAEHILLTASGM